MVIEIIRAILEKVLRDKIFLSLIAIGILAVFFTGANTGGEHKGRLVSNDARDNAGAQDEAPEAKDANQAQPHLRTMTANGQPQPAQAPQQAAPAPAQPSADAAEACQFVRWWLSESMNFQPATAAASHKNALGFAKPAAAQVFVQQYWSPELAQAVTSGTKVGSLELSQVNPLAVNPDGSVVIKCLGVLSMQDVGNPPMTQNLEFNFLVKKEPDGYRVLNFFSQGGAVQTPQVPQVEQQPQYQEQMVPERRPYRPVI